MQPKFVKEYIKKRFEELLPKGTKKTKLQLANEFPVSYTTMLEWINCRYKDWFKVEQAKIGHKDFVSLRRKK